MGSDWSSSWLLHTCDFDSRIRYTLSPDVSYLGTVNRLD